MEELVERMREALIDIVDMVNTDQCTWLASTTDEDWMKFIRRIEDVAHRGLYGEETEEK
jgi:hypothetical protein